jgi:hypothetical protein
MLSIAEADAKGYQRITLGMLPSLPLQLLQLVISWEMEFLSLQS